MIRETTKTDLKNGFVYLKTTDNLGREYFNIMSLDHSNQGVLTKDGVVTSYAGYPKIVLRKGRSKYGDQVYFKFWIKKEIDSYKLKCENPTYNKYNFFEVYFTLEESITFLETSLKILKRIQSGVLK